MSEVERQILLNQLTILKHFYIEGIGSWGEFGARVKETIELLREENHVCDCCKGKRKTAGGFRWEYADK